MEERKHIDRVFQEKFKDFEATPREAVWKNISSRLQERERKKSVLPLWYRFAGVAAVLALFFSYTSGLFKNNAGSNNEISAVIVENEPVNVNPVSRAFTENMIRSSIILQAIMQDTQNREAIEEQAAFQKEQQNTGIIRNYLANTQIIQNTSSPKYKFSDLNNLENKLSEVPKEAIVEDEAKEINNTLLNPSETKISAEITNQTSPSRKLRISTMAAPIFYNVIGSGSSIDPRFVQNENSSEVTMSYGINLAYQISENIRIRSGVNKVDMSYNTNNISFTATVNPSILSGVNYGENMPNFRIDNTSVSRFSNVSASAEFNRASLASPTSGYLNQKFGFIEVPVEIEFVIIDKKFGLNIIGGGSTLFLDNNMVSLNSANFSTNLGESNSLRDLSFTTNLGVGIDYKITPQLQLNFEPTFKYQISTFNNSTGNLNPYFLGIYSGVSFKF